MNFFIILIIPYMIWNLTPFPTPVSHNLSNPTSLFFAEHTMYAPKILGHLLCFFLQSGAQLKQLSIRLTPLVLSIFFSNFLLSMSPFLDILFYTAIGPHSHTWLGCKLHKDETRSYFVHRYFPSALNASWHIVEYKYLLNEWMW